MAESSTIGASFSQYQGNPALGGGGLGAVRLDTKPIEDFGRYMMFFNKAEYDQRQKDMEKAAEELADFAALDLSTTIPKHAQILQSKYDELFKWVQENPDALKYNIRDEKGRVIQNSKYLEYKKKKADLMNDIKFVKMNSILNTKREEQIASEPNEKIKRFLRDKLNTEIDANDIRQMLGHAPKYDLTLPDYGQNKGQSLDVLVRNPNDNILKQSKVFDITEARRIADIYKFGMQALEQGTETGQQQQMLLEDESLRKASNVLNNAIAGAMKNIDTTKSQLEQDEQLKKELSGIGIMSLVNQFNDYMGDMRTAIKEKRFDDEVGKRLNADDYTDINFRDGISDTELSMLAQFAGWEGDKMDLKQTQTNNAIEWGNLAARNRQLALAEKEMNEEKGDIKADASTVLNSISQMVNKGQKKVIKNPDGSESNVVVISDPDLMRQFGTLESDGTTKDAPDEVQYDLGSNKVHLRYYKRDKKSLRKGLSQEGIKAGERLIDLDKDKSMEPTEFITSLIKKKFPNKDVGSIGSLVNKWYEASGNNLSELAKYYNAFLQSKGEVPTTTEVVTKPGETKTSRFDKYREKQ